MPMTTTATPQDVERWFNTTGWSVEDADQADAEELTETLTYVVREVEQYLTHLPEQLRGEATYVAAGDLSAYGELIGYLSGLLDSAVQRDAIA